MTLLLLCGMTNEAWAVRVTYHVLTMPFTTHDKDNSDPNKHNTNPTTVPSRVNIRVEAFYVVVDDESPTVGLPEQYMSPLAHKFRYYAGTTTGETGKVSVSASRVQIYEYNTTTYNTYTINGTINNANVEYYTEDLAEYTGPLLKPGSAIASNCDIYVTYEYNSANGIIDLTGNMSYNIKLGDRFLAFNHSRANRPAAIPAANVTEENLNSNDFTYVTNPGFSGNHDNYFHFRFKFHGPDLVTTDPYNITLYTAYEGDETFFSDDNKNIGKGVKVRKWYKGSRLFLQGKSDGSNNMWLSSDYDIQFTQTDKNGEVTWEATPGYYRGGVNGTAEMRPIWNSLAILPAPGGDGVVFMGTKINGDGNVWQPTADGKYFFLTGSYDNGKNPRFQLKKLNSANPKERPESTPEEPYEVRAYTYKVRTPITNQVLTGVAYMSEVNDNLSLLAHIPDELKRKYVTFTGTYKNETYTDANAVSTFADVEAANNDRVIWLTYETEEMPFETLPSDGDYRDAHWYTMRMNNDDRYIAFYDDTKEQFNTGRGSNSVLHQGENSPEAMVAFMGDPFELKILNRAASETASANRYIGCASDAEDGDSLSVKTGSSDISSWEIVDDDDFSGSIVLRQLGTYASPKYIGWHYGVSGNPLYYKTTSSRIKVVELEKKKYVYHIYNTANQIAIKATTQQDVGMPLSNYTDIPEIIRSPFLALPGVTVKFYHSSADALADTDAKDYAPYDVTESTHKDIYVRYFNMSTALAAYRVKLNGSQEYNVRLNGQYLSYNSSGGPSVGYVNSQATITDEQSGQEAFIWKLLGSDPYAMQVTNTTASLSSNNYVHASSSNDTFVSFGESGTAAKFIIKSGTTPNTYEVMYATGDEVDADTTYYHIGRRDANRVKIYSYDRTEGGIQHGSSNISFVLTLRGSIARFYHLVDKKNNDLLTVRTRDERLSFPGDYWSPLVGTYHYYLLSDFNVANGPDGVADTGDDIYTLKDGVQELDGFINNPPFHGTYRIIDRGTDNTAYVAASSSLTATDLADLETKIRALSSTGTYEYKVGDTEYKTVKVADDIHIYVTYTTSNRVNLRKGVLYLLKFQSGDSFRQENGADGLTTSEVPAVYPYCNGDCNFFIYGQDEYELQQQGAASTRTRWAWYVESADNDPYHVKICSRQMETYNGYNQQAYFYTFVQNIDGVNTVVTSLAWPGITGVQGTEYMVLGSVGQYQLVTSDTIYIDLNGDGDANDEGERARQVVKAFEQYWKTYDTVKNKLLKNILEDEDKGANPEGSTTVPSVPASYRELLTGTGEGQYGFHSYNYWAYAKRFNGYNSEGKTSKGWEQIEHWYQTVNMGEGYFDFVPTVIAPVLILLDQHGWEIMRKPLPYSDQDPRKEQKKDVLRTYDSPMVKEYIYWSSAKKRSGFHQYYQLEKRIGGTYTSTSLGDLPPWGSENILDAKGNQNDEYVTYTVKDEYVQTYSVNYTYSGDRITDVTGTGQPFLIQQGDNFAFTNGSDITPYTVPVTGGMSQWILDNIGTPIANGYLWYLKPNTAIDTEMGYGDPAVVSSINWVNDYDDKNKVKASGFNSWAFDPYNIQISSVAAPAKYFVTNATGATIEESDGAILGTYSATPAMSLGGRSTDVTCSWYDSRRLDITNTTFMAVSDEEGNMQLMPRFDQVRRVRNFSTLVTPTEDPSDVTKLPQTYTKVFRPIVYNYHIIDNQGREALRYQSAGDLVPQTPDHFKSPLAKDFMYYAGLTLTDGVYTEISTKADVSSKEITESLAGKGLTATGSAGNEVYVRYSYDTDADVQNILRGRWFTMQLNNKDAKYNDGIKQGSSKPAAIDGDDKVWQWKFTETPFTDPDPYAACLFNREYNGQNTITKATPLFEKRFAILPHTDYDEDNRVYALAEAGIGAYTYRFLNGANMTTSVAAVLAEDKDGASASGFKSTSCTFHATDSRVELFDDVLHTYTYKIYTHANELAIEADQTFSDASNNDFRPVLPAAIKSPLLNDEDFRYYYTNSYYSDPANPDTVGKELQYMYGLYDDLVYVHYMPYNSNNSSYLVPNVKTIEDGHVARGGSSNDAPLGLDGKLLYNIIWYNDNMMFMDGAAVKGDYNEALKKDSQYVWTLEGNDPYAIRIKNFKGTNNYINSSGGISTTPQKFMLIPEENYGYGVLAVTGTKANKLTMATDDGNDATHETVSVATTETPTPFIFFGLATHKMIYHLVIAKTYYDEAGSHGADETVEIPYWDESTSTLTTKVIKGSTQRDLSSKEGDDPSSPEGSKYQLGESINDQTYSYDAGIISLGDKLAVPDVFYRPNVVYQFFVEGIYDDAECTEADDAMNTLYKGHEMTNLGDNPGLLNKTVRINIVYTFNGSLETNAGADFVRSVAQNKWYTFEARKANGTPQLMQFTNAWGMEVKEGRGTHYTNDYLWTPLGDPYGFIMYHRYTCVNSGTANTGEPDRVMTTAAFSEGQEIWMDDGSESGANKVSIAKGPDTTAMNAVYELLEGDSPGFFKVHPVANKTGTQYYLKIVNALEPGSATVRHDYVRLSATGYSEFTYGLTEELVKPYYDRAGYVGGLTEDGKTAYEAATNLMEKQAVVYNPDNIVKYTPGYYRLHSPEDIEVDGQPLRPVRYASGYTHKLELTGGESSTPIPMHFYEVEGTSSTFNQLKSKDGSSVDAGYTRSNATRGDIPIPAVEYDPASIFYFYEGDEDTPLSRVQTQGLYLKGEKGPGLDGSGDEVPANVEAADERAYAVMTTTAGEATPLYVMDIGGAILLIHDNVTANGRAYLKYLCYDQTDADHIYDMKLTHNTHTDHAKWLMQPANHHGLRVTTHSGGDAGTYGVTYNYATFYAPFDVMLPDTVFNKEDPEKIDKIYHGVILESANSPWSPPNDLHPQSIGRYNIAVNGCPAEFRNNNRFIPAGTPVLLAMYDAAGYVKMTLPTSSPSPSLTSSAATYTTDGFTSSADDEGKRYNILSGQYLEQKLELDETQRIYSFGLPFNGEMELNPETGAISATLPLQDNSGMGFYLNANPNKELGLSRGEWSRNNWYVYSNKAYYHATGIASLAPAFVPVIFDEEQQDEEQPGEEQPDDSRQNVAGDGCIYDMLGRKVATAAEVENGTWQYRLQPGIYIIDGKKIFIH